MFHLRPKTFLAMVVALFVFGCAHEHVNPAVLHPETALVRVANRKPGSAVGCGFLISANGMLVTTSQLMTDGSAASVTLSDGRTLAAAFVAEDRAADVVLLKIAEKDLPFLTLHGEESEPVIRVKMVTPSGFSHGIFDRWEDSGQAMGFTARVTPADAGAPLLGDDNTVIGVVREPSPSPTQLATPIWHVIRMLPVEMK